MSDWRDKAVCRADPDLWFGKATGSEAVHICKHHCPVRNACRRWAVGAHLSFVTAGGIVWNADGQRSQAQPEGAKCSPSCRAFRRTTGEGEE